MKKRTECIDDAEKAKEQLRRKAIELHSQNWKIKDICSALDCSRSWLYKWIRRYKSKDNSWYESESRAPHTVHKSTDEQMEQLVVNTRKDLMAMSFSQIGPQAIYYRLRQQGYTPPPIWTIARVLQRHTLTKRKDRIQYIAKGKKYPYQYSLSHQMDFVGPRYLSCKSRYYFLNIIDCDTHWSQTGIVENQTSEVACNELIRFWKIVGIPDFLQIDNELAFWGSLRVPNVVGKVVRLSLLMNVTPVFIPKGEPWRNGVIEHYNNTMQRNLLAIKHENIQSLKKTAAHYDEIHNKTHRYSTQSGMTPQQAFDTFQYPIQPLREDFTMPTNKIPLEDGEIHVIRFVRSNLQFDVFGLTFTMPEIAKYEYIRGIILTGEHKLLLFKDQQQISEYEFKLP